MFKSRYSQEEKTEIITAIRERQAAGLGTITELVGEYGISIPTFYNWSQNDTLVPFRSVQVVKRRDRRPSLVASPDFTLVSPSGWRVEGLSLQSLRQFLGC